MPATVAGKPVRRIMLGGRRVNRIMLGGRRVWSAAEVYDDFNRGDEHLDAGGKWRNEGPSLDYVASVNAGRLRLGIPDGLPGLVERISQMTYTGAAATGEDGWLEILVASIGDSIPTVFGDLNFVTQVFARMPGRGFTDGVGIDLRASQLSLVHRRDSMNRREPCGAFAAGDLIRMDWSGPDYTMALNGHQVGEWTDKDRQVRTGPGYRHLGVRVDGAKELLGPRRFSPALDWVEYGTR